MSSYVNVKTNKKENEFTYAAYHVRTSYTFLYKQKQVDLNLLFPLQRAIHILHQNLMNSSHRHGVEGMTPSLRLFSFFFVILYRTREGHSYMYLITHMRWKGIYHGALYLRNWNSLHPMSTNKSKFCHYR